MGGLTRSDAYKCGFEIWPKSLFFSPHIDMYENPKGFTWLICWGIAKYILNMGHMDFY